MAINSILVKKGDCDYSVICRQCDKEIQEKDSIYLEQAITDNAVRIKLLTFFEHLQENKAKEKLYFCSEKCLNNYYVTFY